MVNNNIFIVECRDYIAAIIQGDEATRTFLNEALPNLQLPFSVVDTGTRINYPFWIVETNIQRKYYRNVVWAEVKARESQAATLYTIEKDFGGHPTDPGKDYMGSLPHEHFDR